MKTIVVNATALDTGGGLTVLKQFIDAAEKDREFYYLIFVNDKVILEYCIVNVRLVPMPVKSLFKRFMWDAFGLKRWLKKNNIEPSATISLQNTNFRVIQKLNNYVYYHQSIPFFDNKWSLFKSEQRALWFYKHIYPFFVNLFLNDKTEVFVQLEFIKNSFAERFNFPKEKIHVIRPNIVQPSLSEVVDIELDNDKINLFYPATPFFYKNHQIIIDALSKVKSKNFVLYLTCKEVNLPTYPDNVDIRLMGTIPFERVLSMYTKADALLFPSYIETYGLPLIEAASFGLPILAADLEYSREVLQGYQGVSYVKYNDVNAWVKEIENLKKGKKYDLFKLPENKSWPELLKIITYNL